MSDLLLKVVGNVLGPRTVDYDLLGQLGVVTGLRQLGLEHQVLSVPVLDVREVDFSFPAL